MDELMMIQRTKIKSSIVNSNNWSNELLPSFDRFYKGISLVFHLIDNFPSYFSFYVADRKNPTNLHKYFKALDFIVKNSVFNPHTAIANTNASIKNNITTSISHVISKYRDLSKESHYAINITTTKAELFIIRCGISQACQVSNVDKIIVVTGVIHVAKHIFDSSAHPFQIQSIAAVQSLRAFFNRGPSNIVKFWNYPSKPLWPSHATIDKKTI